MLQILSRPQHKEVAFKSIGLAQICRPFVGFFLFCIGKLLLTIFIIGMYEMAMPGFIGRPFTTYHIIAMLFLSPLGLHFFLPIVLFQHLVWLRTYLLLLNVFLVSLDLLG